MSDSHVFELEHSVPPDPSVVDGEVATRDWPLPPARPVQPAPPRTLLQRIRDALS